jgi:hypothetical protein
MSLCRVSSGAITPRPDTYYIPLTTKYLCDRALKFPQLVRTKSQLAQTWRSPPSIQERPERVFLRPIERPAMPRHIRVQQPADPKSQNDY